MKWKYCLDLAWIVSWLFCLELDVCLESCFWLRDVLECCFVWNGLVCCSRVVSIPQQHLQILPPSRENPSYRVEPLRGKIPAMMFGSMSLLSRGYRTYGAMFSGLWEREILAAELRSGVVGMFV